MRREVFTVVAVLGIAACGSPAPAKEKNPQAPALEPAVVNAPIDLPPLKDTTTHKWDVIPLNPVQRNNAVLQGYAVVAATTVNHDAHMLSQMYDYNAVLHAPDSTVNGSLSITKYLLDLAQKKSLTDWPRITQGQRIVDDSTLVDSGLYRMVLKRSPKDSTIQDGHYKSTWRARKDVTKWVLLEDLITPDAHGKKKTAK